MLVDQLVDPQPAASGAVAAPHLEHVVAFAEIVEGRDVRFPTDYVRCTSDCVVKLRQGPFWSASIEYDSRM